MIFELNIGLLVEPNDTWDLIQARYRELKHRLDRVDCRFEPGEEPTLVARGEIYAGPGGWPEWLHQLCLDFDQDCLAVYYPHRGAGQLIGPRAEAWGDFQRELFTRY